MSLFYNIFGGEGSPLPPLPLLDETLIPLSPTVTMFSVTDPSAC